MSTQKGNNNRCRPQKHQNRASFKNTLHDTSHRTKLINNVQVSHVCERCKEVIEWKIKYKKYKPLTQPKTCVKCSQKTVKHAYHVMCNDCGNKLRVCTKCCQAKEVIECPTETEEQLRLDTELQQLIQSLPERKRRTFISKADLISKLSELKVQKDDDFSDTDSLCSDLE
ncbi:hypothetical protein FQA39_LY08355 [Lamprigera yunnana]|nr:hypothetical protein FQA39_LY08355 [Lamprigera yunnana]